MTRTLKKLKKDWENNLIWFKTHKPIGVPVRIDPDLAQEAEIRQIEIDTIKKEITDRYGLFVSHPAELTQFILDED